jgi:hypothetical protein
MRLPDPWKTQLFNATLMQLKRRSKTLQTFYRRFGALCPSAGFEYWLKVELIAAIPKSVVISPPKRRDHRADDLDLTFTGSYRTAVELKATCQWSPTYNKPWSYYYGRLLIFLCVANRKNISSDTQQAFREDLDARIEEVCILKEPSDLAFYLGFVDLGDRTFQRFNQGAGADPRMNRDHRDS